MGLLQAASLLICEETQRKELGNCFPSLTVLCDIYAYESSPNGFLFLLDFFIKRCVTHTFFLLLMAIMQLRKFFSIMSRLEDRREWAGSFSVQIKKACEKYPEYACPLYPRAVVALWATEGLSLTPRYGKEWACAHLWYLFSLYSFTTLHCYFNIGDFCNELYSELLLSCCTKD